jgi:hypothetical protein
MSTWNNVYKQNPPDDNNPGYGAASIRDLKTNIEGLITAEHKFPLTTNLATQGQHKAGSAIVDLPDATIDDRVNNNQIGRLRGYTDGDDKTTLQVLNGDLSYVNIFGINQVSNVGNETISGVKTFNSAPLVTQVVDDGSDNDTIANVGYVKTKTSTTSIEPTVDNVGPSPAIELKTFDDELINTMPIQAVDSENLEEFLLSVKTELFNVRSALIAVAPMSPYGQDLSDNGSPTFAGVTVNGTLSATRVEGAVWG